MALAPKIIKIQLDEKGQVTVELDSVSIKLEPRQGIEIKINEDRPASVSPLYLVMPEVSS